jgi:hypothetical protein
LPVVWSVAEPGLRIQIWLLGLLFVAARLLRMELARDVEGLAPYNKGMQISGLQQWLGVAEHPLPDRGGGERSRGGSYSVSGSWGLRRWICSCAALSPSLASHGGEGRSGESCWSCSSGSGGSVDADAASERSTFSPENSPASFLAVGQLLLLGRFPSSDLGQNPAAPPMKLLAVWQPLPPCLLLCQLRFVL